MAATRQRRPPVGGTDFIGAAELARRLGLSTDALSRRVAAGHFPAPWATLSRKTRVWRRDHYEHFVATGKWPAESVKKKGGGK
jgi:predicted DNA-binding transcriptional regulator AlpA